MKTKLFAWTSWITFLVSAVSEWGRDIDLPLTPALWLVMAAVVLFASNVPAALTTNSWINSGDGLWHVGLNWSLGVTPSNNQAAVLITNAATKTVVINNLSAALSGVMTISNLTVSAPANSTNTLFLNSVGTNVPLRILKRFTLGSNSVLRVTNSVLRIEGTAFGDFSVDGDVTLESGSIVASNNNQNVRLGNTGRGSMTLKGGTMILSDLTLGFTANSAGTLTISGGTNIPTAAFDVGFAGTGAVWLTGGLLSTTDLLTDIGFTGVGLMSVSNGTWRSFGVQVAGSPSSQGTLTIAGGTTIIESAGSGIFIGNGGTGTLWMTGGELELTNSALELFVGSGGVGQMTVSNGTVNVLGTTIVAATAESSATLTIAGGTNNLGNFFVSTDLQSTGTLWVTGGRLVITNGSSIVGRDGPGLMIVSNGTVLLREAVIAFNSTARGTVTFAGGTNTLSSFLNIGANANATGAVFVTGGQLVVTNAAMIIASNGVGQVTQTGGTMLLKNVTVGFTNSSQGTLTVAGGTNKLTSALEIGSAANATGAVWLTGGELVVTNDDILVGVRGVGQMTVSNGTWRAVFVDVGELAGSSGTLTIAGGTNAVPVDFIIADLTSSTGAVWLTGGQLVSTNTGQILVGNFGAGQMTVSNGTWVTGGVRVAFNPGSQGTLTVASGVVKVFGQLLITDDANVTGTVWVTGGQLVVANTTIVGGFVGSGVGRMIISNGTVLASNVVMGAHAGMQGTLTMAGGTNTLSSSLVIASTLNSTGTVVVTGGQLTVTNASTVIGSNGVGQVTQSGGTMLLRDVRVTFSPGSQGTLTAAGGTGSVYSNLTIGDFPCTPTGAVVVAGGNLFVTNSTLSAVLEVRAGTLTLSSGGVLVVDKFVLTNACAHFVRTGGTLHLNSIPVLDATRDDDGDGIPNSYELSHGLDPLNPADAALDNDGDGQSNLAEFLAGTDPNNSASGLRILKLVPQDPDMRITWTGGGGTNYAVQAANGGAGGSFTNDFSTLATISLSGVGDKTNTYVDTFGATNAPARYYRVRLVP